MASDQDSNDYRGIDDEETSPYSIDRRVFMMAAGGLGAGGLFETTGVASAQQGGGNTIELEAVLTTAGELNFDVDDDGTVSYNDVVTFFENFDEPEIQDNLKSYDYNQNDRLDFDDVVTLFERMDDPPTGGDHVWRGVSPDDIADRTNPTLSLIAGETYTVEWTNVAGGDNNFVIADENGNELVSSPTVSEEGATQSVEFQVTDGMAEYYSGTHSGSQRGTIQVTGGDLRPPIVSPNEIGIGASPSSDATVLWNGEEATLDQWHHRDGSPVQWTDQGEYFQVNGGTGDILSDAEPGDCHLHLEWRAPADVSGEGQSRNNSGVKIMDRYEFQILDNYENPTYADGWAGAYYGQAPPLVSPLRPPGEWQAYDIIWHVPRFEDGELVRPAQATLLINGVVVIAHLNIDGVSGGTIEPYEPHPPEAPVMLQDHQSDAPPQFRNIWYRPLEEDPVDAGDTNLSTYDTTAGSGQPPAVTPTGPATEGSPPSDAQLLFDDDGLANWESVGGGDPGWIVNQEYVEVVPGEGDIRTEDSFGDSQVHLEWRVPEDVEGEGLDRGNSGLLMMGRYQVQILDNDGNPVDPVKWAGSYPDQAAPQVSPIRSQGEWQTLDVVWQGPRFDGDTLEKPAQVTVLLNETVVQSRLVVNGPNPNGTVESYEPHSADGPIRLEDGGDSVQFRNLWQRSLDPTADAERLSAPYGLNVGGVSSGRSDLSPDDTVEIDGVEFEPYTESIDPDPAVTLVGQHNESGANGEAKEIEGTDADEIYQTMMWSTDSFGYEILMEPGTYDVTLHLAEINYTAEASPDQQRTFSAYIQGEPVFEGLETWDKPLQAISRTIEGVQVGEEPLVIELESSVENPMVNAIEIRDSDAYAPENPVPIPYGLNAGGVSPGRSDSSPGDTVEVGGVEFDSYTETIDPHSGVTLVGQHSGSSANELAQEIQGTGADAIYQTMMWGEDEMGYEIEVEPGTYEVTFHLAEIFQGEDAASGSPPSEPRIYSAYVEGEPVFEDLALLDEVGELVAHTESIVVDVEGGPMDISLESSSENPMVNAIEIRDADDPRPDEQHLWLASEHETDTQPDSWEPQANVENWGIAEDSDGIYLGLEGAAEQPTSLRFAESTEADEMEVWAIAKATDPDGSYWVYGRGYDEDAPSDGLTGARFDDHISENSFRLSTYDDGELSTAGSVDHVGVNQLYQMRGQVVGDTVRVRWWPVDADEPDGWDIEAPAPTEELGYAGIGHWVGDAYQLYAFGVGLDGAAAPSSDPADILGPYADNPAVPPEEALDTFELPDGWTIEQVAAEPMLDSPVDVKWDAKGRMWVVEMPDYMELVPGDGRGGDPPGNYGDWGNADMTLEELTGWGDELTSAEPNGVVKMLEDTDGDGVMDESTTFTDELTLSRSLSLLGSEGTVMIAHSGSAFAAADLFTATDQDGDLAADTTETVKSSWVSEDNPEHTSNGLDFNLNNWLYSANSGDRFRYRNGDIEESNTHTRGQWGVTQDNYGRLYTTTNPNWLYADLVPNNGEYLLRGSSDRSTGVMVDVAPDNTVYPIQEVWGTNRSYPGGPASHRDDGRLESVTAVSSPEIYRGDIFSAEFVGDAFVPEPAAHVVAHFDIEEEENGLDLAVEHEVYDNEEWGQQDFLASTDEVFRPINIRSGPDGALYIVDMYNGIFQHNRFLTDYLAEYFLEHNLHKVPPAGRIYRVYPEGAELDDPPALDELSPAELAAQLEDGNGWIRKTAQRLIVQEQKTDAAPALREIAAGSDDSLARMHALWALDGLNTIDADSVFAVMDDIDDSHVLADAMATGEALLGTDDVETYVDRLIDFTDADHIRLVIQAAVSLGKVADSELQANVRPVLQDLLMRYEGNDYVKEAVRSSPEMDISVDAEPVSVPFGYNAAGGEIDGTVTIDGLEFVEESLSVTASGDASASGSDEAVSPSTTSNSISGTEHDPLYQSMQYGGNLSYEIAIENGTYDVTLYFVEYTWEETGGRVFDISVEGRTVYSPLDIYAEVGSNTALTRTVEDVEVTDGTLIISSATEVDNSSFSGFAIRSSDGSGGDVINPGTAIDLGGEISGWKGRAPGSIDGETNPELSLQEGETYTVTWENLDGAPHDFYMLDGEGNEIEGTGAPPEGYLDEEGGTASVTFTATEEMVEYYCSFHPTEMRGNVTI